MKLYIDSTDNLKTIIRLDDHQLIREYSSPRDQDILAAIDEILQKNNATPQDLTAIEVNPGPGSFTGARVGVSIANAFAYSLDLPINGQQPPIEPIYDSPPNITFRKVVKPQSKRGALRRNIRGSAIGKEK